MHLSKRYETSKTIAGRALPTFAKLYTVDTHIQTDVLSIARDNLRSLTAQGVGEAKRHRIFSLRALVVDDMLCCSVMPNVIPDSRRGEGSKS